MRFLQNFAGFAFNHLSVAPGWRVLTGGSFETLLFLLSFSPTGEFRFYNLLDKLAYDIFSPRRMTMDKKVVSVIFEEGGVLISGGLLIEPFIEFQDGNPRRLAAYFRGADAALKMQEMDSGEQREFLRAFGIVARGIGVGDVDVR